MQFKKEDLFTIPNILTYIRFLCLPIFIAFMSIAFNSADKVTRSTWLIVSFLVFIFAEITDIVDGKIARKYNMVTDIGKVMDPVADKLMQCFAILMIALVNTKWVQNVWFIWVFVGVLIAKEVFMGVSSKYFMRASKRQIEQMANKIGKAGAVINFVGIILTFLLGIESVFGWFEIPQVLTDIIYYVDMVVLLGSCVMQIYSATQYTVIYGKQLKELRASGILDTLDRYGNPLPKDVEEEK